MEHPHEQTLHAYVDKALGRKEEEALCAHLSRCQRCRDEVDALSRLFHDLKHLPEARPSRELTPRILLARQRERGGHRLSVDLASVLFARIGWAAVAVGLLTGILLGRSVGTPFTAPSATLDSSPSLSDPEDPYLGYLLSDNGDIL